eukprot:CAMPEP_0168415762 /NCGR_PEP_ID=MMETSP0228-20121227/30398_1 /TAXON_ID=133427 /ORGANISM="Protoceratium reticulatum, Strain CCCM 535 (=CCMP 1889)" /LENGTH=52 /DNA_ID=CAMNT_0008429579 /DNA_START=14 /DNA_END=169 /DNA_ORIENTATION=+
MTASSAAPSSLAPWGPSEGRGALLQYHLKHAARCPDRTTRWAVSVQATVCTC